MRSSRAIGTSSIANRLAAMVSSSGRTSCLSRRVSLLGSRSRSMRWYTRSLTSANGSGGALSASIGTPARPRLAGLTAAGWERSSSIDMVCKFPLVPFQQPR